MTDKDTPNYATHQRIMLALYQSPYLTINDLKIVLEADESTLDKHFKTLIKLGFIKSRPYAKSTGNEDFTYLTDFGLATVKGWTSMAKYEADKIIVYFGLKALEKENELNRKDEQVTSLLETLNDFSIRILVHEHGTPVDPTYPDYIPDPTDDQSDDDDLEDEEAPEKYYFEDPEYFDELPTKGDES